VLVCHARFRGDESLRAGADVAIDHRAVDAPPQVFISRFDPAREIRRSARRALDAVRGPAETWWASISAPAAVAAEAERQAAGYQFGYYFGARITAAFTYARLGELARAKQRLIEIDPAGYGPARVEDGLAKLEIVAAGTHLRSTKPAATSKFSCTARCASPTRASAFRRKHGEAAARIAASARRRAGCRIK